MCRDGSRDEQALYGECAASLEADLESDVSLATPTLETSRGTFTFDRVESVFGTLGDDGYDLVLEDQALVLNGTICGQPFGSCPQP